MKIEEQVCPQAGVVHAEAFISCVQKSSLCRQKNSECNRNVFHKQTPLVLRYLFVTFLSFGNALEVDKVSKHPFLILKTQEMDYFKSLN